MYSYGLRLRGAKIDLSGGASAPPPTVGYGGGTGSGGYSYGGGRRTWGGRTWLFSYDFSMNNRDLQPEMGDLTKNHGTFMDIGNCVWI